VVVDHGHRPAGFLDALAEHADARQLRAVEQHGDVERGQRFAAEVLERRLPREEVVRLAERIRVEDHRLLPERREQVEQRRLGAEAVAVRVLVPGQQEAPLGAQEFVKLGQRPETVLERPLYGRRAGGSTP
jgi:hypothetical protein